MLTKQKRGDALHTPRNRVHTALFTLNFLNLDEQGTTAAQRHWQKQISAELRQPVFYQNETINTWDPAVVLRWGQVYALISTGTDTFWIPAKHLKLRDGC